jgi:aryl-alcohol dehydrogenase-like predicted oxidoreductase
VGISDAPAWIVSRADTLAQWRGWSPFVAIQVPYSLVQRDAERELLPMADALGLGVTAWSPLGGGVLSGKYRAKAVDNAGGDSGKAVQSARLDPSSISARDHAVAAAVGEVAEKIGATSAQVALAWVRRWSPAVRPIVGARTVAQLRDNLQRVELSDEQAARLEAATEFTLGFPGDFIAQTSPWVFGAAAV